MVLSRFSAIGLLTGGLPLLFSGCSSDAGGETDGDGVSVVVTTSVWADVVDAVTCRGQAGVDVVGLIPAGADPHGYEASLRDRELIEQAALVVSNGRGLEAGLVDLLDEAGPKSQLALTDSTAVSRHDEDHHADDAGDDGHDHADGDPHIWLDPTLVAATVEPLMAAIVDAGSVDADRIARCAAEYAAELRALDAEIADLTGTLPAQRRVLVTDHDAYGYFAERYGFEVIGTVLPSSSTMAEANPADLADLAATIEDAGVPAIFVDSGHPADDAKSVADAVGVDVVALHTESVGADESNDSYLLMMRSMATIITEALGAGSDDPTGP